jgi:hypothetical protein
MKVGDLVRCKIRGRTGLVIRAPRNHSYDNRPGKLYKILWADGTQMVHINNVEVISEESVTSAAG